MGFLHGHACSCGRAASARRPAHPEVVAVGVGGGPGRRPMLVSTGEATTSGRAYGWRPALPHRNPRAVSGPVGDGQLLISHCHGMRALPPPARPGVLAVPKQ